MLYTISATRISNATKITFTSFLGGVINFLMDEMVINYDMPFKNVRVSKWSGMYALSSRTAEG
jgi:hypothetical protein